jgi:WD40 repeat protein
MVDVFISYSRDDSTIGRAIHTALKATGRDLWMDFTSVPLTAEWWKEITDGIELAEQFVFLISPSSVASPICNLELEYARSLNKRIVPVVVRKTIDADVSIDIIKKPLTEYQEVLYAGRDLAQVAKDNWLVLSALNWVNFANDKDVPTNLPQLIEALDTDLAYIRSHTRWFIRAQDWERRGKLPDALLSGKDLSQAETWLKGSKGKEPEPLDIHERYIKESRVAEDERLRLAVKQEARTRRLRRATITAGIVGMLSLIAVILSGIRITEINDQVLQGQKRIRSLDLAASSGEVRTSESADSETAALLAIRALDVIYTPQADTALIQAIDQLGTLKIFLDDIMRGPDKVIYSPDGRQIVTIELDTARIWDVETGRVIRSLTGHTATINDIEFSPNSQFIVSASSDNTARMWDVRTGSEILVLDRHRSQVNSASFSPNGRLIVTASGFLSQDENIVQIWDIATGQVLRRLDGFLEGVSSAVFSPDGQYILTTSTSLIQNDSTGRIWNALTGELIVTLDDQLKVNFEAVYSPDGRRVIASCGSRFACIWDAETGRRLRVLQGHTKGVATAIYSPNANEIVTAGFDRRIYIWSAETFEMLCSLEGSRGGVSSSAFSPDSLYLVTTDGFSARLWNGNCNASIGMFRNSTAIDSAFSPDANYVTTTHSDGTAKVWSLQTGDLIATLSGKGNPIVHVAYSPTGKNLLIADNRFSAYLWDTSTYTQAFEFRVDDQIRSLEFSPDGRDVIIVTSDIAKISGSVYIWDTQSGRLLEVIDEQEESVASAIHSPTEPHVALTTSNSEIQIWNIEEFSLTSRYEFEDSAFITITYSPDGQSVALLGYESGIGILDVATGNIETILAGRLSDFTNRATSLAYSPNGEFIATGMEDGSIQIWDLRSMNLYREYKGHSESITRIEFSYDGLTMLTQSFDDVSRVWHVKIEDLIDYSCTRIFQDFTSGDGAAFGIPYGSKTCE